MYLLLLQTKRSGTVSFIPASYYHAACVKLFRIHFAQETFQRK